MENNNAVKRQITNTTNNAAESPNRSQDENETYDIEQKKPKIGDKKPEAIPFNTKDWEEEMIGRINIKANGNDEETTHQQRQETRLIQVSLDFLSLFVHSVDNFKKLSDVDISVQHYLETFRRNDCNNMVNNKNSGAKSSKTKAIYQRMSMEAVARAHRLILSQNNTFDQETAWLLSQIYALPGLLLAGKTGTDPISGEQIHFENFLVLFDWYSRSVESLELIETYFRLDKVVPLKITDNSYEKFHVNAGTMLELMKAMMTILENKLIETRSGDVNFVPDASNTAEESVPFGFTFQQALEIIAFFTEALNACIFDKQGEAVRHLIDICWTHETSLLMSELNVLCKKCEPLKRIYPNGIPSDSLNSNSVGKDSYYSSLGKQQDPDGDDDNNVNIEPKPIPKDQITSDCSFIQCECDNYYNSLADLKNHRKFCAAYQNRQKRR